MATASDAPTEIDSLSATSTQNTNINSEIAEPSSTNIDSQEVQAPLMNPAVKRARLEAAASPGPTADAPSPAQSSLAASSPGAPADEGAKLELLLSRLQPVLASDSKLPKGMKILTKAVEASLNEDTSELFFPVLEAALVPEARVHTETVRASFLELGQLLEVKMNAFKIERRFDVESWILSCTGHNGLFTDDSFRYNKAAKRLRDALIALDSHCGPKSIDFSTETEKRTPAELQLRKSVLISAMQTMLDSYRLSWARPTVDCMMKVGKLKYKARCKYSGI